MNKTYLQLGSNEGNSSELLKKAIELLEKQAGELIEVSALYESEAWGKKDQKNFLNMVLELNTTLSPNELLSTVLSIEEQLGRERKEHWGPRTMDIDILFYNAEIIKESPKLIIPHPRITERKFVLLPMNEIAADFIHPIFKRSIAQLLFLCEDSGKVWKI
ncbi:MAG: 2-amino-4-hydroxy-6-hydroxymethyldihydropteridine diphosphokinase [Saprospiraceae bacterium]|nr:2-amino-4-hydroxy-6-hydroxymethyldihydropteridine diphosphokinase [Saprospiraceae bacterium]